MAAETFSLLLVLGTIAGALVVCVGIVWLVQRWFHNPSSGIGKTAPTGAMTYSGPFEHLSLPAAPRTVVVVHVFNHHAGFGWLLYNVQHCARMVEQMNANSPGSARMVVFFSTGLYQERREHHLEPDHDRVNWFNNYFCSLEPEGWRPFLVRHFDHARVTVPHIVFRQGTDVAQQPGVLQFNRNSLNSVTSIPDSITIPNLATVWQRYLVLTPHMQAKLDALRMTLFPKGDQYYLYALHYRGTDKFSHSSSQSADGTVVGGATEDNPEHPPHEWLTQQVLDEVKRNVVRGVHGPEDYYVYVASDEAPFVRRALGPGGFGAAHGREKPGTLRAEVDTSGLEMDTRLCGAGKRHTVACRKLDDLVQASVHRGMPHESNYRKGEDVLLEVLLMAGARHFFRSRGNVSNCVLHAAPTGRKMKITDTAEVWRQHRRRVASQETGGSKS